MVAPKRVETFRETSLKHLITQCVENQCKSCEDVHGSLSCEAKEGIYHLSYCNDENEFIEQDCDLGCDGNQCLTCIEGSTRCGGANYELLETCELVSGRYQWVAEPCDGICENGYCHTCTGTFRNKCAHGYHEACKDDSIQISECQYGCLNETQCRPCFEGQFGCSGNTIAFCLQGKWNGTGKVCPDGCSNGSCDADENKNHMKDAYDGDWENAAKCVKHSECDSGFCDHFVDGGKCMNRCTEDSQCVEGFACRPDGRCAPKDFVTVWETTPTQKDIKFNLKCVKTSGNCKVIIDWDGEKTETKTIASDLDNSTLIQYTFNTPGEHTIKITTNDAVQWGIEVGLYERNESFLSVESFGPIGLKANAFHYTGDIKLSKIDIPDATLLDGNGLFNGSKMNDKTIRHWDMSMVTNAKYMFYDASQFNQDLSSWDVSHITNMYYMFSGATSFTGTTGWWSFKKDLNNWDVSNVTDMSAMFWGAESFKSDLSKWDVSKVTDMHGMFRKAWNFNRDISDWNVQNVKNMSGMFSETSFNQDISKWNVSNVTEMSQMFYGAVYFNQDISNWVVSKVTKMDSMFKAARAFNQNLSKWNVSNVKDMSEMFYDAESYNQPMTSWNVSNVTNMKNMFTKAEAFNSDISKWNVSKVTDMSGMFTEAKAFNQNISGWNVSNVTNMSEMFWMASAFNQDISGWNVSNVTNMSTMLCGAYTFNQPLGKWNVSKVTNMEKLFWGAESFNQDISNWNVSNVTNMYGMFNRAKIFNKDISKWDVSNVSDMSDMFNEAETFNQDISKWNVSNVLTFYRMFAEAKSFNQDLSAWSNRVKYAEDMRNMFTRAELFSYKMSWNPITIIKSQGCGRVLNIFDNTKLTCSDLKEIVDLWKLSSIGCTAQHLDSDCK